MQAGSSSRVAVLLVLGVAIVQSKRVQAVRADVSIDLSTDNEKASTATADIADMRRTWEELKTKFYDVIDVEDDQLDAVNRRALQTAENTGTDADIYESTCVMCQIMCAFQNCDEKDKIEEAAQPSEQDIMQEYRMAAERCDIVLELDAGKTKPSKMFKQSFDLVDADPMSEEEFEARKDAMYAEQSGRFERCSELLDGERERGSYRDNLNLCAEKVLRARRQHEETQQATGGIFPSRKYPDEQFMDQACRFFTERGAQGQALELDSGDGFFASPYQYRLPPGWTPREQTDGYGRVTMEFRHEEHCQRWRGFPKFLPYCRASTAESAWYKAQWYENHKLQQQRIAAEQRREGTQSSARKDCPAAQCGECLRAGARFCNPARDSNPCRLDASGRPDYTDCMSYEMFSSPSYQRSLLQAGANINGSATVEESDMLPAKLSSLVEKLQGNSTALVERVQGIFRTRRPWEPGILFDIFFGIISGCARFIHFVVTLPIKLFPSVFRAIVNGFIGFKNFWLQGVGFTSDHLRVWPWCWAVTNGPGSLYNHRVCR